MITKPTESQTQRYDRWVSVMEPGPPQKTPPLNAAPPSRTHHGVHPDRSEHSKMSINTLYTNDNLHVLNGMNSDSVDLIYLDPPFNTKRLYSAPIGSKAAGTSFKDMWEWKDVDQAYLERMIDEFPYLVQFIRSIQVLHGKAMMAYTTYMAQRLIELHRVLKPTGSLYVHVDPTASHYLKLVLDRIFGKDHFRNEIIWFYSKWSNVSKQFQANHDVILLYASKTLATFQPQYVLSQDKKAKLAKGYQINVANGIRQLISYDAEIVKTVDPKRYDVLVDRTQADPGAPMPDVWGDINILNSQAKERTGYPTQKPLALLDRIIRTSSREGDLVLDPFCGCATTMVAAQRLGRRWIGIDIEAKAADIVAERLGEEGKLFNDFVHRHDPPVRTDRPRLDADVPATRREIRQRLVTDHGAICAGCETRIDPRNLEVDHVVPRSKGGQDIYENYQLLCGHCNRTKGHRPMEYLLAKIAKREEALKNITFGKRDSQ